ncbi:MAG: DUF4905 domain-containing protein [Bacteroidota bacterium]
MIDLENPFFAHTAQGKIWKTIVSEDGKHLIWEDRDEDQHQVSFGLYSLTDRKVLKQKILLEERWWVTVMACNAHRLIFGYYEDSEDPSDKKIVVFDLNTNETVKTIEQASFEGIQGKEILVRLHNRKDELFGLDEHLLLNRQTDQNVMSIDFTNQIIRPNHYEQGSEYALTVQRFLNSLISEDIIDVFDYLEYKESLLISYYCRSESGMVNNLLIGSKDFSTYEEIMLADNVSGIGSDTFWIINDQLFFVQDKDTLLGYDF